MTVLTIGHWSLDFIEKAVLSCCAICMVRICLFVQIITIKGSLIKQPRRWQQQKPHKFTYLTMKNSISARFARAVFIVWHFEDVLVLSTTWNDLFCSCVDDVSKWCQMFSFVVLCPKRWFQFNSRTVSTHFSSIMTSNNWKMIAETRSYIFRWRSRFRRRRVCLGSLKSLFTLNYVCVIKLKFGYKFSDYLNLRGFKVNSLLLWKTICNCRLIRRNV